MYDKFGRDWKMLEYFLLQRVCNRLQQAMIVTSSPARIDVFMLQRRVTAAPVFPLKIHFLLNFN
jgi:hypothetical protein